MLNILSLLSTEEEEEEEVARPQKVARITDFAPGKIQLEIVPLIAGITLAQNEHAVVPFVISSINDTLDQRKCITLTITLLSGIVKDNLDSFDYRVIDYGASSIFQLKQFMRKSSFDPDQISATYKEEDKGENYHRANFAYKDTITSHEDSKGQVQVGMTQWLVPFKVNKYIAKEDTKVWADKCGTHVLHVHLFSLEQSSH